MAPRVVRASRALTAELVGVSVLVACQASYVVAVHLLASSAPITQAIFSVLAVACLARVAQLGFELRRLRRAEAERHVAVHESLADPSADL